MLRDLSKQTRFSFAELKALHAQFVRQQSARPGEELLSLADFHSTMTKMGAKDDARIEVRAQMLTLCVWLALPSVVGKTWLNTSNAARVVQSFFQAFQRNLNDGGSGLTFSELAQGLSIVLRGSVDELAAFEFSLWDADGDGAITPAEFKAYLFASGKLEGYPPGATDSLCEHLFSSLGTSSLTTVSQSLISLRRWRCRFLALCHVELMCRLAPDTNNSGLVELAEFQTGIMKVHTLRVGPPLAMSLDRCRVVCLRCCQGDIVVSTLTLGRVQGRVALTPKEHEALLFLGTEVQHTQHMVTPQHALSLSLF